MKNFKIISKAFSILIGSLGVSALMSSCNKERDCDCTVSNTETYANGQSYSYTNNYDITVQEKCVELNRERSYTYSGSTYTYSISCENK